MAISMIMRSFIRMQKCCLFKLSTTYPQMLIKMRKIWEKLGNKRSEFANTIRPWI